MPEPQMKYTRANDGCRAESLHVEPSPESLDGVWFNTDPQTGEIRKVELSAGAGAVVLRTFGADGTETIDWGETAATPFVDRIGGSLVTGFRAEYDFGFMKTALAMNVKYGVLVIQSYNEFLDESGRGPYFTREFFSQEIKHAHPPLPPGLACAANGDVVLAPAPTDASVHLTPLIGHWTNTNPATSGITHFDLFPRGDRFFLRASGAGSAGDWGEAEATPHAYDAASQRAVAFLARYAFGFAEIILAANENKGLIIIASYHRFTDGSRRANYFKREFFYRAEAVRR
jgi:hypothetical protein